VGSAVGCRSACCARHGGTAHAAVGRAGLGTWVSVSQPCGQRLERAHLTLKKEKISYLTTKKLVVPNLTPKVKIFLIRSRLKFTFLEWHYCQNGHVTVLTETQKDDFAPASAF
jgi:hypothetical protein